MKKTRILLIRRKRLFPLSLFILLAAVCAAGFFFTRTPPETAEAFSGEFMWYYIPQEAGEPPQPMEKAEYIGNYRILYLGKTEEKVIYLTFDDCPENQNIPAILDILEEHGITAAFFMNETYIRKYPEVVRRAVDAGCLICNHTAHHVSVTRLSFSKFKAELRGVEEAYRDVTGKELSRFFRPPQGLFTETTLGYAQELGYTTVFWSFSYDDWNEFAQLSASRALSIVMKETHPGEIALFHCQSRTNLKILDGVITAWSEAGYSFGSLEDLAD